jgi:hypothetical protein
MESPARYIIRACFSQERMTYTPEKSKVIYVSKNGKEKKEFEAPVSSTGQAWNGWRPCAAMELERFLKSDDFIQAPINSSVYLPYLTPFVWLLSGTDCNGDFL